MPLSLLSEASIPLAERIYGNQAEANPASKTAFGSCSGSAVILAGSRAIAGEAAYAFAFLPDTYTQYMPNADIQVLQSSPAE